jgi:secreted PhoX family phosphatase
MSMSAPILVKPNGRLTDDGARYVHKRRAEKATLATIALELGVSVGTVYNCANGRTHGWLAAGV